MRLMAARKARVLRGQYVWVVWPPSEIKRTQRLTWRMSAIACKATSSKYVVSLAMCRRYPSFVLSAASTLTHVVIEVAMLSPTVRPLPSSLCWTSSRFK
jgi:hypothetical protein